MVLDFASALTDWLYGAKAAAARFSSAHPGERVVLAAATKAVKTDVDRSIERGVHWVTSRRSVLVVSDRRIACGDWDLSLDQVKDAELTRLRGLLFPGGAVLKVATHDGRHFQFGLQRPSSWPGKLPFAFRSTEGRVGWSTTSAMLRVGWLTLAGFFLGRALRWW